MSSGSDSCAQGQGQRGKGGGDLATVFLFFGESSLLGGAAFLLTKKSEKV